MAKGEFLVEVHQTMTGITIKEFARDGVRLQANAVGTITGKYTGRHLETLDILQKQDGSNEWESRIIQTTTDGDVILIASRGTGKPDTSAMLRFQGEGTIMTQSKKFAPLNNTPCWIEGTNDLKTDVADFRIYTMK